MKTKLPLTPLLLTIFFTFTSCSVAEKDDEFIYIGSGMSVYGDTLVSGYKKDMGAILSYTDLNTLVSLPVCFQPNCDHSNESKNCTARLFIDGYEHSIKRPFIYGKSLYFFSDDYESFAESRVSLYKCELNGGNRRKIYTREPNPPENAKSTVSLHGVYYHESKLYMPFRESVLRFTENELTGMSSAGDIDFGNAFIVEYDLQTDKYKTIFESGFLPSNHLYIRGVAGDKMFFGWSYNSNDEYANIPPNELTALQYNEDWTRNEESGYWDTYVESFFYVDVNTGELVELDHKISATDVDYAYYFEGNSVYKLDPDTFETELVFETDNPISWFRLFDDNLFVVWYESNYVILMPDYIFQKDGQWNFLTDIKFNIEFESDDKFIGSLHGDSYDNLSYILKEDFYAGNMDYVYIFEQEDRSLP